MDLEQLKQAARNMHKGTGSAGGRGPEAREQLALQCLTDAQTPLCDPCLATAMGVNGRTSAQQPCLRLHAAAKIQRQRAACGTCNSVRLCNAVLGEGK